MRCMSSSQSARIGARLLAISVAVARVVAAAEVEVDAPTVCHGARLGEVKAIAMATPNTSSSRWVRIGVQQLAISVVVVVAAAEAVVVAAQAVAEVAVEAGAAMEAAPVAVSRLPRPWSLPTL